VVRRLVHQQHLGLAEHRARHGDAHLPAAREVADVAVDALVLEAQPVQDLARLALERVAAEVLVLVLHLAEPREDRVHRAGLVRIRHRVLERLQLVMQIAQPPAAGDHFIDDRPAAHLLDVLPEVADRQPLRHRHVALVRRFLADDHPEQRRLAGSVRADQPTLSPELSWKEASTNRTWRPYCLLIREKEIMEKNQTQQRQSVLVLRAVPMRCQCLVPSCLSRPAPSEAPSTCTKHPAPARHQHRTSTQHPPHQHPALSTRYTFVCASPPSTSPTS
jgi:hypothetical protein